eukprot:PITA_12101
MSQNFALIMQKEFEMSLLGELTYLLGLQIQQKEGGIFLSQTKYLKQILKKYGMEDAKPVCTPMVTGCSLSANDESTVVHQPTYRSMIGSLLYLTGTRPDIMHVVGIVGRFQENPKETHLQAVNRILKYLQGTQNYGLWYPRDTDLTLHAYTDVDWAGSVDDRKSTSGGAFFMGSKLVSWFTKKQSSIALSTAEAEYVAAASCCTQLLWMMQTLQDFQITCTPPISILCDNTRVTAGSRHRRRRRKSPQESLQEAQEVAAGVAAGGTTGIRRKRRRRKSPQEAPQEVAAGVSAGGAVGGAAGDAAGDAVGGTAGDAAGGAAGDLVI